MKTIIIYPTDKQTLGSEINYDKHISSQIISATNASSEIVNKEHVIKINKHPVKIIFDYNLSSLGNEFPSIEDGIGIIPVIEPKPDATATVGYRKLLIFSQIRRVVGTIATPAILMHEIPVYMLCLFHNESELFKQATTLAYPVQNIKVNMAYCYADEVKNKILQLID